jgi:hypothetical protein
LQVETYHFSKPKPENMKIRTLTVLVGLMFSAFRGYSQESETKNLNLAAGADLASSYIWRGIALGSGAAAQPWAELSYKGLAFGTWGSYEIKGAFNEVDVYAKYTRSDFSLLFVDLFFPDYVGLDQNYFNFKNSTTGHCSELGLSFNGNDRIPFSVYGGMIVYGTAIDPGSDDPSKVNHSPYFEVKYLGTVNDYSYNVFAGFTPVKSAMYLTDGFDFVNAGLSGTKTMNISDKLSVPLKVSLATNPSAKKIFLTLIISL